MHFLTEKLQHSSVSAAENTTHPPDTFVYTVFLSSKLQLLPCCKTAGNEREWKRARMVSDTFHFVVVGQDAELSGE